MDDFDEVRESEAWCESESRDCRTLLMTVEAAARMPSSTIAPIANEVGLSGTTLFWSHCWISMARSMIGSSVWPLSTLISNQP